jgi:NUMOD3 motif
MRIQKGERKRQRLENPEICKCGCGLVIPFNPRYVLKYYPGHWNKNGKQNPNYGHVASEETRRLISLGQNGKKIWTREIENYPEARKKLSESMSGDRNRSKDPEISKKMLETKKKRGSSILGGKRAAETARRNGTLGGGRCKWIEHGDQRVQGKFELRFVEFLDSLGIKWKAHKGIETFRYVDENGNEKIWQPDIQDEFGNLYDPHAKYFWDQKFEYKIAQIKHTYPDRRIIVFNEDNFSNVCNQIKKEIVGSNKCLRLSK